MGQRIGIIAGAGRFVAAAVADFQKRGLSCVVAGLEGEASRRLARIARPFEWISIAAPLQAIAFLRDNGVKDVLMLGKVRPVSVYGIGRADGSFPAVLDGLEARSTTAVLQAAVAFLESQGLRILDPLPFFEPCLCRPGQLTSVPPSGSAAADIDFGLPLARRIADLDIGQTMIVKGRAVVAVEGMEGTDRTIRRGGRLAGAGFSVVKAGRTSQDMRFDVPAVGLDTVRAVIRAGGAALGLDAGKVAFFQREEALALAEANGLAVVARTVSAAGEVAHG